MLVETCMELRRNLEKVPQHLRSKQWIGFPDVIDDIMTKPSDYNQLMTDYRYEQHLQRGSWAFFIGFSKYLANKHFYKRVEGMNVDDDSVHCAIIALEVLENLVWSCFLEEPSRNIASKDFPMLVLQVLSFHYAFVINMQSILYLVCVCYQHFVYASMREKPLDFKFAFVYACMWSY